MTQGQGQGQQSRPVEDVTATAERLSPTTSRPEEAVIADSERMSQAHAFTTGSNGARGWVQKNLGVWPLFSTLPSPQDRSPSAEGPPGLTTVPGVQAGQRSWWVARIQPVQRVALTFSKFIGPGFMIAVAYSEPRPPKALSH